MKLAHASVTSRINSSFSAFVMLGLSVNSRQFALLFYCSVEGACKHALKNQFVRSPRPFCFAKTLVLDWVGLFYCCMEFLEGLNASLSFLSCFDTEGCGTGCCYSCNVRDLVLEGCLTDCFFVCNYAVCESRTLSKSNWRPWRLCKRNHQ